jgi:ABC-type multidrug transport system ATPase subunit
VIQGFRARGKTVLLTTHYMAEAERVCDRLCVLDHGRVIARGAPSELIDSAFPHPIVRIRLPSFGVEPLRTLPVTVLVEESSHDVAIHVRDVRDALAAIAAVARAHDATVDDLRIIPPTLEDVFLRLTGRQVRD